MSDAHKSHKGMVRLSTVSKGKAEALKGRRAKLNTIGKMHLKKKHDSPEVAMRQIMLFEKQRDFLVGQQATITRKNDELTVQIGELEEKIVNQRKRVQKMVGMIAKDIKNGKKISNDSHRKHSKPPSRSTNSSSSFTLEY
jgi:hypothetical protein